MSLWSDNRAWRGLTLPVQFLLACAIVMSIAMALVGTWVAGRIETAVVQNSGVTAALFMESFIAPLSQELAETDSLSPPARQALTEIFAGTALGERVVSYKIWLPDGRIVHASDPALAGQRFPPSAGLRDAAAGRVSASFEDLNDLEDEAEAALGVPLLEVYSPVRRAWTGDVIAVAEFYERADVLAEELHSAQQTGWLVVGGAFLGSALILFGIVQAGGRTIRQQRQALRRQLAETEKVSRQNMHLRQRAVSAAARATAQTERAVRRIGFDLHDGPAQYLSLASLRLDGAFAAAAAPPEDVGVVRKSLAKALDELRIISRGLALPDLDQLDLPALAARATDDHRRQTGMSVTLALPQGAPPALHYAQKLCVFRFLQETLSNATRHGAAEHAAVRIDHDGATVQVTVHDDGRGFDAAAPRAVHGDGGQGLFSLSDRAESIGGHIQMNSTPGAGTTLTLTLPLAEIPA